MTSRHAPAGSGCGRGAGRLRAGDAEAPLAGAPRLAGDGDAVHGDAVERRLVALGPHRLRKHGAGERRRAGATRPAAARRAAGSVPRLRPGWAGTARRARAARLLLLRGVVSLALLVPAVGERRQFVERGVVLLGVHGLDRPPSSPCTRDPCCRARRSAAVFSCSRQGRYISCTSSSTPSPGACAASISSLVALAPFGSDCGACG